MSITVKLSEFTNDNNHPFGNKQGKETFSKLSDYIESHSSEKVIGISLEGIEQTDASFPRESVISLVKSLKGERGFYLVNLTDKDVRDNWHYAAIAKEQTVIIKSRNGYDLIGPSINTGEKELLDFIMKNGTTTTAKVANAFDLSAQNASAKLKKLHIKGLIMGEKEAAESGGLEFIYTAIK